MFPNVRGGRVTRQRVAEVVRDAAAKASERLVARKLPPVPVTTPHSLRRTYISIALLATRFDVLFVMSQVGHADSKMTTDVYAQLQNRIKREHGSAFDRLVARAREQLHGVADPGQQEDFGTGIGTRAVRTRPRGPRRRVGRRTERARLAGSFLMARPGLEPGTPRFSVVCSTS